MAMVPRPMIRLIPASLVLLNLPLALACTPAPSGDGPLAGAGGSAGSIGIGTAGAAGGTSGSGGAASGGSGGTVNPAGGSATAGGGSGGTPEQVGGAGQGGQASVEPDAGPEVPSTWFVYVAGYAPPISVFTLDPETATLTPGDMTDTGVGGEPTFLAASPDKRFMYAIDEQLDGPMARVIAFTIDPITGALTEINRQNTGTSVNAHVAVHQSGDWVLSANYGGGSVTVFPVREDGGLEAGLPPVPAGGQAHQIVFDSTGSVLFVPCLTSSYIAVYDFAGGVLTPRNPATVEVEGGPRHIAFTPDERFAYVITQGESKIHAFSYDKAAVTLTPLETYDSTPQGSLSAHIEVHRSGKFLYTTNRNDNSVGIFSIDPLTGALTNVGHQREQLNFPRLFAIDPDGELMIVGSQHANTLLVHRIDQDTGELQVLGDPIDVPPEPTYVGILPIP